MDQLTAIEQRRRNLRIVLFVIILATLPFYCAGILLWGTAPSRNRSSESIDTTGTLTRTPIGLERTASITPRPTNTPLVLNTAGPLQPTPGQFIPQPTQVIVPTQIIPPTLIFVPTFTLAPTLTPYPTNPPPPTAVPPTNPPLPTDPPLPTSTPVPTNTPIPTDTPTTEAPLPFDTEPIPEDQPVLNGQPSEEQGDEAPSETTGDNLPPESSVEAPFHEGTDVVTA